MYTVDIKLGMTKFLLILSLFELVLSINSQQYSDEIHMTNIRQLTFNGHHSLPTFSYDGNYITFAAHGGDYGIDCDQIFRLNLNDLSDKPSRISPGIGYATNPKHVPKSNDVTFETNFHRFTNYQNNFVANQSCPKLPCKNPTDSTLQSLCATETWPLYPDTDVFRFNEYGNIKDQLTFTNKGGYNGEGWIAGKTFDGQKLYYTSKDGEGINYYVKQLNVNENKPTLLTNSKNTAYYGGMSIDHDERGVTFHGHQPIDSTLLKQYLSNNLVPVKNLQIYHSSFDGFEIQQVNGLDDCTSFYPVFANKNGNKLLFSTNYNQTYDNIYSLYMYNIYDETLLQISTSNNITTIQADVSYDYNKIVFISNRNSTNLNEYQIFIADFNVTGTSKYPFDGGINGDNNIKQKLTKITQNDNADQQCWQNIPTDNYYDGIVHYPGEKHLKNVKQLTFGGENAEGYFSFDDNKLTLQATGLNNYGTGCDHIYQIDLCKDPKKQIPHKMSTGIGVTTCSYFFQDNKSSLYAGTFKSVTVNSSIAHDVTCPIKSCDPANPLLKTNQTLADLCKNATYVWDIYPEFDIFMVNEYGIIKKQLTNSPGYDAEGVISPDGTMIAFTSMRNGDLDLYIMNTDGTNVRQITNVTGYDGGAFFSPDNKKLIFRASRPKPGPETDFYKLLLQYNMVEPIKMELFVVNIDGTNMKQITNLGGASWAPYYLPDNKRVIFSSDFNNTQGFGAFDLYVINDDGTGLERITWDDNQFDAFPMFSHKTNKLVWGSSRNGSQYDLNLFIADWVDNPNDDNTKTTTTVPKSTTSSTVSNFNLSFLYLVFIVSFFKFFI